MTSKEMTEEVRDYLDKVAAMVYPFTQYIGAKEKEGIEVTETDKALLELGRAYLYLYNQFVDEKSEETSSVNAG